MSTAGCSCSYGQAAAKYCRLFTRASQYAFESGGAGLTYAQFTT